MFEYEFMKNALIAILIITPMFGILGTRVVSNRMAFFSDALGHSAFTGVALGILLGIADTNISMIVFAIIFALLLNCIKYKNTVSQDTLISVFSSLAVAIGISILSRNGDFSKYLSLLIGDILSVTVQDIIKLLICLDHRRNLLCSVFKRSIQLFERNSRCSENSSALTEYS